MRPIVTDRVPWFVGLSVCGSVRHISELCKNDWTNRDGVWVEDSDGPRNRVLDEGPDSPWKGARAILRGHGAAHCKVHARETRLKCDFLSSIQEIKEKPNVVKISARINTIQNINILLFVRSLSLTSFKALQLSTVGLSTIKHQLSKRRWHDG